MQQALKEVPDLAHFHYWQAFLLEKACRKDEALKEYEEALESSLPDWDRRSEVVSAILRLKSR